MGRADKGRRVASFPPRGGTLTQFDSGGRLIRHPGSRSVDDSEAEGGGLLPGTKVETAASSGPDHSTEVEGSQARFVSRGGELAPAYALEIRDEEACEVASIPGTVTLSILIFSVPEPRARISSGRVVVRGGDHQTPSTVRMWLHPPVLHPRPTKLGSQAGAPKGPWAIPSRCRPGMRSEWRSQIQRAWSLGAPLR